MMFWPAALPGPHTFLYYFPGGFSSIPGTANSCASESFLILFHMLLLFPVFSYILKCFLVLSWFSLEILEQNRNHTIGCASKCEYVCRVFQQTVAQELRYGRWYFKMQRFLPPIPSILISWSVEANSIFIALSSMLEMKRCKKYDCSDHVIILVFMEKIMERICHTSFKLQHVMQIRTHLGSRPLVSSFSLQHQYCSQLLAVLSGHGSLPSYYFGVIAGRCMQLVEHSRNSTSRWDIQHPCGGPYCG